MTEAAIFFVSEAKFGILPPVIGPDSINAVGEREARRLALAATSIDAAEALEIGHLPSGIPAAEFDQAIEASPNMLVTGREVRFECSSN